MNIIMLPPGPSKSKGKRKGEICFLLIIVYAVTLQLFFPGLIAEARFLVIPAVLFMAAIFFSYKHRDNEDHQQKL